MIWIFISSTKIWNKKYRFNKTKEMTNVYNTHTSQKINLFHNNILLLFFSISYLNKSQYYILFTCQSYVLIFQIIKEILLSRINQIIDNPIHFRIFKFVENGHRTQPRVITYIKTFLPRTELCRLVQDPRLNTREISPLQITSYHYVNSIVISRFKPCI